MISLRVKKLNHFCESVEITFDLNRSLLRKFKHLAGQYITLRIPIDGVTRSRSYSITGLDHKSALKICVKRVPGGIVSNYLYSQLQENDEIIVDYPEGDFVITKQDLIPNQSYVFITGGSGITPIIPMIKEVLEYGRHNNIYLIYGNRDIDSIIYLQEISKLRSQVHAIHYLDKIENSKKNGTFRQGILSESNISQTLNELELNIEKASFYLSGPPVVVRNAENVLAGLKVPKRSVLQEQFFIDAQQYADGKDHRIRVRTAESFKSQTVLKNMSILDSCLLNNIAVDHSCRIGECKKCSCTLLKGAVNHRGDIKNNKTKILACQSFPLSDDVIIDFKKNIFQRIADHRTYSLFTLFFVAFLLVLGTRNSIGVKFIATGPLNTGHEEISCLKCHKDEDGTVRQQLQGQIDSYLHDGNEVPFFVKRPLQSGDCISCHDKDSDRHPIHRFNEPKFKDAKHAIHPEKCTSCHMEHNGKRITLKSGDFCMHCHETLSMKEDPIKPTHELLIKDANWESCLQCHDYHGNHVRETPTLFSDTISKAEIKSYFEGGNDPYSKIKTHKAIQK